MANNKKHVNFITTELDNYFDIVDNIDSDNEFDFDIYNELYNELYSDSQDDEIILYKSNTIFCKECKGENIVEDIVHGFKACRDCGIILNEIIDSSYDYMQVTNDNGTKKEHTHSSQTISQLLPQSSTATTISGSFNSRIKTLHTWSTMPYKERSLNEVFKLITKVCNNGKILKCIEDDAKIMYKNISNCKHSNGKNANKTVIIRGRNRSSLIAAIILWACRKKGQSRSPKEICSFFDSKYVIDITKGNKIFRKLTSLKNIDINVDYTTPNHFITRFCDELKLHPKFITLTLQIAKNIEKLQIAAIHTPLSIATGAIYLMCVVNNLNISKKTIAAKFNVSQVTIAKAFKKIEPFSQILFNDIVCDALAKEIINYQNNITIDDNLKLRFIRFGITEIDNKKLNLFDNCDSIDNITKINNEINTFIKYTDIKYKNLIDTDLLNN